MLLLQNNVHRFHGINLQCQIHTTKSRLKKSFQFIDQRTFCNIPKCDVLCQKCITLRSRVFFSDGPFGSLILLLTYQIYSYREYMDKKLLTWLIVLQTIQQILGVHRTTLKKYTCDLTIL